MNLRPKFARLPSGDLRMIRREVPMVSTGSLPALFQSPDVVEDQAVAVVRRLGGNVTSRQHILGQYTIQFAKYRGQTFHWVVENALGFCAYIVYDMRKEARVDTPLSANKFALKECVNSFPQGSFYKEMINYLLYIHV
ncbi:hypothetical protein DPMN_022253 [Dreissena polymorpha]|uniref:Uncharacterized protein n=1 Tax=Dreissena polymorpha TaxID=45954 RepID=A0A9D4NNC2_DREPO|nr:hypothetical protein DPMN_022253 [Dreissena polymorpha]